jgi:hypothetical protein
MSSRPKRYFSEFDTAELLAAVAACRRSCVLAMSKAPIGSEGADAVSELMRTLDRMAELLTGDREHLWARLHSTPKRQA